MAGLVKWKKAGEHTFRRMRKDETLAESLVFEMQADGKAAARIIWHDNRYTRVKSGGQLEWTVNNDDEGLRLDKFLAAPERLRSRARRNGAREGQDLPQHDRGRPRGSSAPPRAR